MNRIKRLRRFGRRHPNIRLTVYVMGPVLGFWLAAWWGER